MVTASQWNSPCNNMKTKSACGNILFMSHTIFAQYNLEVKITEAPGLLSRWSLLKILSLPLPLPPFSKIKKKEKK